LAAQKAITLADAIKIGLINNYSIKIAEKKEKIAQLHNTPASAGQYPTIDLFLAQNNQINSINDPTAFVNGFYRNNGLNANAEVNWTIFDGFKVKINKERLAQLEKESAGHTALVVENTIHAIILTYNKVLMEEERLKIIRQMYGISRGRYYEEIQKRYAGLSSDFDVLQFENAFLADSLDAILQKSTLEMAMIDLNLSMGENENKIYRLLDPFTYGTEPYRYEVLKQRMISNSQALKNEHINLQLIKNQVALQESNKYPRIIVRTGTSPSINSIKFPDFNPAQGNNLNFYLNFSLSFTLFNGGNLKRSIEAAHLQQQIANMNLKQIELELKGLLKNKTIAYNKQLEIITVSQKRMNNAEKSLTLAEYRYKSGLTSFLEYRNTQLEYIRAVQTRLNAIYALKSNEIELMRLLGNVTYYM
jgi:outer membrane protein